MPDPNATTPAPNVPVPARVSTVAELDALPVGQRVRDRFGDVAVKQANRLWEFPETRRLDSQYVVRWGPFTVLPAPDGDAVERAAREALVDAYNPQSDEHADHLADVARIAARAALAAAREPVTQDDRVWRYCPVHGDLLADQRSARCAGAAPGHARPSVPTVTAEQVREAAEVLWDHYGDDDPDESHAALAVTRDMLATLGIEVRQP